MEHTSLTINGMSCGHCVRSVDRALRELDGVEIEEVKVGSATVTYDPQVVTHRQIMESVEAEGYQVQDRGRTS